jgi:membrane-associated phospholipid phosphatase
MKQPSCCGAICAVVTLSTLGASAQTLTPLGHPAGPAGTVRAASESTERGTPAIGGGPGGLSWLLGATLNDFKRLPSKETATLLTIGAATAWFGGIAADRSASDVFSGSRTLGFITEPGETIGGAHMQLAGALATYGVGRFTKSDRVSAIGSDLIRAQLLTQAVTAGIKMSVRRTRPDGTQFSFPSGHTSVSFASATVLQRHLGLKVGIPAYAVATYVAAQRIQERRHFLSDVAFGAAFGIAAGRTVTVGRGEARFAMSPTIVPGGAGVSFDWLAFRH